MIIEIEITTEMMDNVKIYCCENKKYNSVGTGYSLGSALHDFAACIDDVYEMYGSEPDENLDKMAQKLKKDIIKLYGLIE